MATPLSASALLRALRAEGCEVREYGSWRTHNRDHKGPWGPVNGVMIHHTVTSGTDSSVRLCYHGHSSLPGPLCHGVIDKAGVIHLVGNGRANHAGAGDGDVLRAVIAERDLPPDNEADTDGNQHFYGFEAINLGDGEDPWPDAQKLAIERASAAICRAHGWNERSVIGHKEWQPGKIDPTFSMDGFRARVRKLLAGPAGADPTPSEEDLMAGFSEADITKAVWKKDGVVDVPERWRASNPKNAQWQAESVLAFIGDRTLDVRDEVRALAKKLDAQSAAISELAKALASHDQQVDADALVARIQAAIEAIDIRLDVPDSAA